jgi:multidrug efflux system membrane fusion protein
VKRSLRNSLLLGVVAVPLLVGGLFHAGLDSRPPARAGAPKGPQAVPVHVEQAARSDLTVTLDAIGRAEAYSTVTVRSRVSGQLQSLAFTPGRHVRDGEPVARIDPTLFEAQLRQAEGALARDQAQLDKARADLARYDEIAAQGFVSKSELDTYRANLAVAEATVKSDQAAVDLARIQLGYTTIQSPLDGVAGAPLAYPGAQVTADVSDLVVINQTRPIHVVFSLPEAHLDAVKRAMAARAVTVRIRLPGAADAITGTLDFVDNAVDPATGTIALKARVENADDRLTPGQFVTVEVPTARLADAVTVPLEALQSSAGGPFVFVLKDDGTVEQRSITPGPAIGRRQVITQGVSEGERVVTEGQLLLVPGAHARIVQAARAEP